MQKSKVKDFSKSRSKIKIFNDLVTRPEDCYRVVGLAGPNACDYVKRLLQKGFEHITLYEKDINIFSKISEELKREYPSVNLVLGDILDSHIMENVFYDLDFCTTVDRLDTRLANFTDLVCTTISTRTSVKGQNREYFENKFFELRGEVIENWYWTDYQVKDDAGKYHYQKEIQTNKGTYVSTSYRDGAPMLHILKVA